MSVCFIENKINKLCASIQQTTSSKILTMPRQQGVFGKRSYKNKINKLTVASRGISFCLSSNNTPSSLPYSVGIKRKLVDEEKSNEELPAVIGYDYSYSTLVINDDLKMCDMSGGNCYLNNHTISQQYCYSKNCDVSCGYVF